MLSVSTALAQQEARREARKRKSTSDNGDNPKRHQAADPDQDAGGLDELGNLFDSLPETGKEPAPTVAMIVNPFAANLMDTVRDSINLQRSKEKSKNTPKSYDPKKAEYFEFCDQVFKDDAFPRSLITDKVYKFMIYQAFREPYKKGKKSSFDVAAFNKIIEHFHSKLSGGGSLSLVPVTTKPMKLATFRVYKNVLRNLYKEYIEKSLQVTSWDAIWTISCEKLERFVTEREPRARRENYEEKMTTAFEPYTAIHHYGDMEQYLWDNVHKKTSNDRSVNCSLRHRYCLLHLTSGILRCESLHRAELSDFVGITVPKLEKDYHQPFVMVNLLAFGKTNKTRMFYGRALRHFDVRRCCIGALSFYLMYRFSKTQEFQDMSVEDWFENRTWFDIKLLADVHVTSDRTKPIAHDSYRDTIRQMLDTMGIACKNILHLGRKMGAPLLEVLEAENEQIKALGNWKHGVFDEHYSNKLPMRAMRTMAGYSDGNNGYYNPRSAVRPSEELLRQTPVGSWLYDTDQKVRQEYSHREGKTSAARKADVEKKGTGATAIIFLGFLKELNRIFVQDAAAMLALHSERKNHPLFKELKVFHSKDFKDYVKLMHTELAKEDSPLDRKISDVVPDIAKWQQRTHTSIDQLKQIVRDGFKDSKKETERMTVQIREQTTRVQEMRSDIAHNLLMFAGRMIQGERRTSPSHVEQLGNLMRGLASSVASPPNSPGSPAPGLSEPVPTNTANQAFASSPLTNAANPAFASSPVEMSAVTNEVAGEQVELKRPRGSHHTIQDIWDEWHGLGQFRDELGGFKGREEALGTKWRASYTGKEKTLFSRHGRVVQAVEAHSQLRRIHITHSINELDVMYQATNKNVVKFIGKCQELGFLKKQKKRGRVSAGAETTQAEE
jgi:hypothetical protein